MRKLLLVIIFLIIVKTLLGCTYGGFTIWPPPLTPISTQPVFVITMYGFNYTDTIRKHKGIFLVAEDDTVYFNILDTFEGEYSYYQVLVTPERELLTNKNYSLECDSTIPRYIEYKIYEKFPKKYIDKNRYYIATTWRTSNITFPKISSPSLKFKGSFFAAKGTSCQNLTSKFKLITTDTTNIIFKVTIKRKGKQRSFFVTPSKKDGLIYIYYDMIGISPFKWYKVFIEAMDTNGNLSKPSKTKWFHTTYLKTILLPFSSISYIF